MKILRIVSLYLFLIMFTGLISAQEMKPEAGKLYNQGNEMLKAGNYNGAIDNYDKALAIEKDHRIYYQKGIALKKSGKLNDSKDAFEAALKIQSDFEAAHNALGGVYYSMGNYQQAIANFEKVLEESKNNKTKEAVKTNLALAYTKVGDEAIKNGNSAKAIESLQKATELNNYDAAYLNLAKLHVETGNYDQAITAAQSALKYRSKISKGGPYYYMGLAYKNKGDIDKAKEMFNQALSDATYRKTVEYELSSLQ
jgi:tetratricopeptide (TPR) repeat protein